MHNNELLRDFKGIWISKEIWFDYRLNALDKIILVEIDSLDATDDGCYASNQYLAEFCQCSETKISYSINKLVELGYLEITKFDGRKRYIKSRVKKIERQTLKNLKAETRNSKDININNKINNNINIYNKYGTYKRVKLTDNEYKKLVKDFGEDYIKQVIERLDEYVESNNNKNKYSNFNLVIRKAIRDKWFNIEQTPSWFNQEIHDEKITEEEKEELQKLLNNI